MNRVQKRQYIRNIKHKKGLQKKHQKGAFGQLPPYLKEYKFERALETIENKEVTPK